MHLCFFVSLDASTCDFRGFEEVFFLHDCYIEVSVCSNPSTSFQGPLGLGVRLGQHLDVTGGELGWKPVNLAPPVFKHDGE